VSAPDASLARLAVVPIDASGEHVIADGGEAALPLGRHAHADIFWAVAVIDASDRVAGGLVEAGELLVEEFTFGGRVVLLGIVAAA